MRPLLPPPAGLFDHNIQNDFEYAWRKLLTVESIVNFDDDEKDEGEGDVNVCSNVFSRIFLKYCSPRLERLDLGKHGLMLIFSTNFSSLKLPTPTLPTSQSLSPSHSPLTLPSPYKTL